MKFKNNVDLIIILVFTTLTLISCNQILETNVGKNEVLSEAQTRIDIYKQEARLLLKASRANLDILELCEDIKYVDTLNKVRDLTSTLEKTHFEISKNYNEIASDKLISIPNSVIVDNEFDELKEIDQESFIKNKLKVILNKTETQMQLLDTLGNITENVEFKVLAIQDTPTLKSNINKIEITLNKFNQQTYNLRY